MKSSPARLASVRVLKLLEHPDSPAVQAILNSTLENMRLSPADRALCTELVYGVLRRERLLDWVVGLFLRKAAKTPPFLRLTLRMAAYEHLCLARIPDHATAGAAVEIIKKKLGQRMADVANGILRAMLREPAERFSPEQAECALGGGLQAFAVAWSLPDWLAALWHKQYGEKTARALAKNSSYTPWSFVRLNARHSGVEELKKALTAGMPDTIALEGGFGLGFPPGSHVDFQPYIDAGRLSRQGAGSQQVLAALDAFSLDGPVWDACAGFGGKTCALLEHGANVTVASDTSLSRLQGLKQELVRLKLPFPAIIAASGVHAPFTSSFQPGGILLDAPCSGLGTLARRPDLRKKRLQSHIPPLVSLQRELLDTAWARLRRGGRLIYVTCTRNPEENEEQVRRLLHLRPEATLLASWENTPGNHGTDLMYGAAIQKN